MRSALGLVTFEWESTSAVMADSSERGMAFAYESEIWT